jgi:hypothetical protein
MVASIDHTKGSVTVIGKKDVQKAVVTVLDSILTLGL